MSDRGNREISDCETVWSTKYVEPVEDAMHNNFIETLIRKKEFRLTDPEIDVNASLTK